MKTLVADIEANGRDEIQIDKKGQVEPEVTEVHCLCLLHLETGDETTYSTLPGYPGLGEGWAELLTADRIVFHNGAMYDLPVLRRLVADEGHDPATEPELVDTLVISRLLYPDSRAHPNGNNGNSLAAWGQALGFPKGDFHEFDTATEEMLRYCEQDVRVTAKLLQHLAPKVAPYSAANKVEHAIANIMGLQKENGVTLDRDKAQALLETLQIAKAEAWSALQEVFPPRRQEMKTPQYWVAADGSHHRLKTAARMAAGGEPTPGPLKFKEIPFNPDSQQQVAERLYERYGWVSPSTTEKGSPQVTEDILKRLEYPEADLMLRYQMAVKRITQVSDWLTRTQHSRDGRLHPSINTNGAATHRATHKQPNQTAVPKVVPGPDGPRTGYEGRYGLECRQLWKPRPGWVQVGSDAAGLELRMLANRMHRWDGGAYAKTVLEGDIHSENQEAAGLATRDKAKEFAYAFLYGAGDAKLGSIVGGGSAQGKALRTKFLKGLPALASLLEWVKECCRKQGYVVLLDGRRAPLRSEHSALNTLLQGDGAVLCKWGIAISGRKLRETYRHGVEYGHLTWSHDEIQVECKPAIAEGVGEILVHGWRRAGKVLNVQVPTDGDYHIGSSWASTH